MAYTACWGVVKKGDESNQVSKYASSWLHECKNNNLQLCNVKFYCGSFKRRLHKVRKSLAIFNILTLFTFNKVWGQLRPFKNFINNFYIQNFTFLLSYKTRKLYQFLWFLFLHRWIFMNLIGCETTNFYQQFNHV